MTQKRKRMGKTTTLKKIQKKIDPDLDSEDEKEIDTFDETNDNPESEYTNIFAKVDIDQIIKDLKSDRKADVILADPPWKYNGGHLIGNAELHYNCLTVKELSCIRVALDTIAADDCALLLWCTGPKMVDGIELMEEWGFKYKTILFVWEKTYADGKEVCVPGSYTCSCYEFVLLGTRGSVTSLIKCNTVSQKIKQKRQEHSTKPGEIFRLIDKLFGTEINRVELFGRHVRENWLVWGNEKNKQKTIGMYFTSTQDK